MNQIVASSGKQKKERHHFAKQQLERGKAKRSVLFVGIVAIFSTVLIFQLSSLYAQPDKMQDSDIYAAPALNVEIDTSNSSGVDSGETIFYEISYANLGVDEATEVSLTISVPLYTTLDTDFTSAGWECSGSVVAGTECSFALGTLAADESSAETLFFVVRVDQPLPAGVTEIDSEVSIADDGLSGPSDGGQQVDSIGVPILNPQPTPTPAPTPIRIPTPTNSDIDASPSLNVEIDSNDFIISAGTTILYEISYSNTGSIQAEDVVLQAFVPEFTALWVEANSAGWTCADSEPGSVCEFEIGSLAPNSNGPASIYFVVVVDEPLPDEVLSIYGEAHISDDGSNGSSEGGQPTDTDIAPIYRSLPDNTILRLHYLPLINR